MSNPVPIFMEQNVLPSQNSAPMTSSEDFKSVNMQNTSERLTQIRFLKKSIRILSLPFVLTQ